MKNLALPRIQKMQAYKPPLGSRRNYDGLLLDFNERTLPPDNKVKEAIKDVANQNLQVYPEYAELEKLTAEYAGVDTGQIMLSNGSDQAIEVLFRTFTEKDSKVIVPSPSFDMFFQNAGTLGNQLTSPLYDEKTLSYPFQEVMDLIDGQTKLVVVCNPNNPTGTLVPIKDIEKIAQKAENSIVCVDEAYYEFSGVSAVGLINKYPNIIVTRTFSKAFGLASLRVGYIVADKMYIDEMLKVRSPYPVNMAAYSAACGALKDKSYMKEYTREVMDQAKPLVEQFFAENNIDFYPSSANFILFKTNRPEEVYEKMLAAGILLRPQNKPNVKNTLRVSIGTVAQMKIFCDIYKKTVL